MTLLPVQFWAPEVVTSFPVTRLHPVSYSFVESETHIIRDFSAFHIHFRRNDITFGSLPVPEVHDIISCQVTDPPASYSLVGSELHIILEFSAF